MGKQTVLYSWESRRYYINWKADVIIFMGKQTVLYSWESRRYYIWESRRYSIHGKGDGILFMGKQTVLYSWESRRYYINGSWFWLNFSAKPRLSIFILEKKTHKEKIILMGKQKVLY